MNHTTVDNVPANFKHLKSLFGILMAQTKSTIQIVYIK